MRQEDIESILRFAYNIYVLNCIIEELPRLQPKPYPQGTKRNDVSRMASSQQDNDHDRIPTPPLRHQPAYSLRMASWGQYPSLNTQQEKNTYLPLVKYEGQFGTRERKRGWKRQKERGSDITNRSPMTSRRKAKKQGNTKYAPNP